MILLKGQLDTIYDCLHVELAECPLTAVGDFYEKAAYLQMMCAEIKGKIILTFLFSKYCYSGSIALLPGLGY